MTLRWQSAPREALAWQAWDGDLVVYDDRNGSTHHLDALAGRILQELAAHPAGLTVGELAGRLDAAADLADLDAALAQFEQLELAHPDVPSQ